MEQNRDALLGHSVTEAKCNLSLRNDYFCCTDTGRREPLDPVYPLHACFALEYEVTT